MMKTINFIYNTLTMKQKMYYK